MRAGGFEPDPSVSYPGAAKPWPSSCLNCSKLSTPRLSNVRAGRGCRHCAVYGRPQTTHSDAVAEMKVAGFIPMGEFPGANKAWPSRCINQGHQVRPSLSRVRQGHGCKRCSSGQHLRVPDDRAVAEMLAAGFRTLTDYPGANSGWRSLCLGCDQYVYPSLTGVRMGRGCRYCNFKPRERVPAEQAMSEARDAQFEPLTPYPGRTDLPWRVRCTQCDQESQKKLTAIRAGTRCRHCTPSGKPRVSDEEAINDAIAAGWQPLTEYPGTEHPWPSVCLGCGSTGAPRLNGIRGLNKRSGCRRCGHERRAKSQLLAEDKAFAMMLRAGARPLTSYPGMSKPWESECLTCHKVCAPYLANVYRGRQGVCKWCARWGIDYSAPSLVYLVTNPEFGSHKIGICNVANRTRRLGAHTKDGWQVCHMFPVSTGEEARRIEQAVLTQLRSQGFSPHLTIDLMPQGGYKETVDAEEISIPVLRDMIRQQQQLADTPNCSASTLRPIERTGRRTEFDR